MKNNIAILCSGGDVSGMNPALKRFVEYSLAKGLNPYFVENGFDGLIDNHITEVGYRDVTGIISRGGTKIRSSRSLRFNQPSGRKQAIENLKAREISFLIIMGGEGSMKGMKRLTEESEGIWFSGIPSTIDNDVAGTEYCLGVDTALNSIKHSIDSIRDTASSTNRAFVIETMGNKCGYLALISALTSGAEMCLIPEIPYELGNYQEAFKRQIKQGRNYFIAIVSEGVAGTYEVAEWFENEVGIESRVVILGHTQRGGNPSVYDRLMAFDFITHAIDGLINGYQSSVVCYNNGEFNHKNIMAIAFQKSILKADHLRLGWKFGNTK